MSVCALAQAEIAVGHLTCEYLENPLGIDTATPRLSWQLQSAERGQSQSAYRVLVASSPERLSRDQGDLWDSGKVSGGQSIQLHYAGRPLTARQECFWKVKVWNHAGLPSPWSDPARWEVGLLKAADWQGANWIMLAGDDRRSSLTRRGLQTKHMPQPRSVEAFPAPLFRREFQIRENIVRARAYVCGLGYNEVYINGQRCGDAVLDPGQTTYDVRAFYVTHDITRLLRPGTNAVGIMLGNGFFGQNHAFNASSLASGQPVLLARIVVDYADGATQTLVSDANWKARTGPILYDNVYGGETYDARRECPGWSEPGFDDASWVGVAKSAAPTARLAAQMIQPVRAIKTLPPQRVFAGVDGKWIFDLGQNIAGWVRVQVSAPAGTQITLRFAERLLPDGRTLDFSTTGVSATGLEQTDIYVCKGSGLEMWQPRFTYHGFRYVEVAGLAFPPPKDFLEGVLVHSDLPRSGAFHCSDELLNQIYQTSLWTIEDNLHSTAEDCPHREKCAWLGDAHADAETGIYNFGMAPFWSKFVDDIETVLGRGGETYWKRKATPGIPCNIAVGRRLCQEARPDWGAAYVLLPWYLYNYYGDTDVFQRHYDHLKRWIEYVRDLRDDGVVTNGYGDWCPPGGNAHMECPVPLSSTAIFYDTLRIMQDFAGQMGKAGDAAGFGRLADETRAAFNRKFFRQTTRDYGSQTADALALRFALEPDGETDHVAAALSREVTINHVGHAFVGIHGGRPLFTELSARGYAGICIDAMKVNSWPSQAYALANGFTTWPEQLDQMVPGRVVGDYSLNHPMQSGFAAWFHESLGGIRPAAPGFKRIDLKPQGFDRLTWVDARHDCPYGPIVSRWRCEQGNFIWNISIPPNTTATIYVPTSETDSVLEGGLPVRQVKGIQFLKFAQGRAVCEIGSGNYEFRSYLQ